MAKKIYKKEELIQFLKWFYNKYDRVPKIRELDSTSTYPSVSVFRRVFGNLENAMIAAEIKLNGEYTKYTHEQLLDFIHMFVKEFSDIPTVESMDKAEGYPSASTYRKHFGSLRQAVIEAVVTIPESAWRNYSKEELIELLKEYVTKYGQVPTVDQMDKVRGFPSASTYRYWFGSLRQAIVIAGIPLPESYFVTYDNEELLALLREYNQNFGFPTSAGLDSLDFFPSSRTYWKRFGSLQEAIKKSGIPFPEDAYYIFSDEELINLLKKYNKEIGYPTYDGINLTKGYPSIAVYINRFGSWENALIVAGFDIPESRKNNFNRTILSDSEILEHMKYHTWLKLNSVGRKGLHFRSLLVHSDFDEINDLPVTNVVFKRFGGIKEAYKKLNIDYNCLNKDLAKEYLINCFQKLAKFLGRTPQNPDLSQYDWYTGISPTAWYNAFGSINNLQIEGGFEPIINNFVRSREELISDLIWLREELGGLTPSMNDLLRYKDRMAHPGTYFKEFGSFVYALSLAGMKPAQYIYTPKGNLARSRYEYRFYTMLENKGIEFIPKAYYKDFISGINRKYEFDGVIWFETRIFFLEIFGVTNNLGNYDQKTKEKLKICEQVGLPLIDLYPKDFEECASEDDLYKIFLKKTATCINYKTQFSI